MRFALFKLFNSLVGMVPAPLMRRTLRAMMYHPEIADRVGYTVYPQVFYSPFPDPKEVDVAKTKIPRDLPGVYFNFVETKNLMSNLARYSAETNEFIKNRPSEVLARWNLTYPRTDSATLYAMLRHLKPKRYIEVGCGWSTRCSTAALKRNQAEGHVCKSTFIEPFPPPYLDQQNLPGDFIKEKIERVPLELFQQLEAGDVLFIDTSHVLKIQNDVEWELIHILPTLKAGVIVHIHDIFCPYDYPIEWTVGPGVQRGGINEQYALECLMSGGGDWDVILPVHQLWRDHRALLAQLFDAPDDRRTNAFWIRKLRKTVPPQNG